jgi:tetratricopeptide (TPR) repeat protein
MPLQKFLFCLFIICQGIYAQKEEALFQAIQEYDVEVLSEIVEHNQLSDRYLLHLSRVYRDYLSTGEEEIVEVDKALQTPQRLLIYTHYQRLIRKGYDPKIHEALFEEIVKSKSIFWQNEMYLGLIQYLNSFTQKEPFLIALLEDYLIEVDTNLLTKMNNYIFQKIVLDLELKKSEINKIMKPNSQLRERLMLLDSLCPDIAYHKAILEQGKAIYKLEFEKKSEEAMKYLKKALVFYDMVPYNFGKKQHTFNRNSLGILLRNSGKYDDAIEIFNSLLSSPFITKNPTSLLKVHTSLEKCYAQIDNSKKAYYHAQIKNNFQIDITP